jgi:hypothetical protein
VIDDKAAMTGHKFTATPNGPHGSNIFCECGFEYSGTDDGSVVHAYYMHITDPRLALRRPDAHLGTPASTLPSPSSETRKGPAPSQY